MYTVDPEKMVINLGPLATFNAFEEADVKTFAQAKDFKLEVYDFYNFFRSKIKHSEQPAEEVLLSVYDEFCQTISNYILQE